MNQKELKSSWSSTISSEKRELFEAILLLIKQRYPLLPQSSLDISKIEYNKDIGHAILESYSRVLESLANTVMSHIEDVLNADEVVRTPSLGMITKKNQSTDATSASPRVIRALSLLKDRSTPQIPRGTQTSITLLDSLGWNLDHGDTESNGNSSPNHWTEDVKNSKITSKPDKILTKAKMSYIEKWVKKPDSTTLTSS